MPKFAILYGNDAVTPKGNARSALPCRANKKTKGNAGAREGTRTPTPLLASGPKPGASTNFATLAERCIIDWPNFSAFPLDAWVLSIRQQFYCGPSFYDKPDELSVFFVLSASLPPLQ
jgi:hypothetical protein